MQMYVDEWMSVYVCELLYAYVYAYMYVYNIFVYTCGLLSMEQEGQSFTRT